MSFGFGSDRPLRRKLVKLACRLLGHDRAHYHSWLPSLKIKGRTATSPGTVLYRGRPILALQNISALQTRAGETITIVGSGPSIKGQNLASLRPRSAILLNGAISLIGKDIAEPLAVAIEDERFIWRHFALVREKVAAEVLCLFSPGVLRAICDIAPEWLAGRSVVLIDDIRKPYGAPRRRQAALQQLGDFATMNTDGRAGFSATPDKGVFQGGSVAISALQFAMATDARQIGFAGIDISNAADPRFYESRGGTANSGVHGAEERLLKHFAIAKDVADACGTTFVNYSEVSALRKIGFGYDPALDGK
jgi:hypothetical protein